jgi:hypothetical protein
MQLARSLPVLLAAPVAAQGVLDPGTQRCSCPAPALAPEPPSFAVGAQHLLGADVTLLRMP